MAVCQANFTFVTLKLQKNKWIDCEYVENFYFFRANFLVIKYSCRYVYSQLRKYRICHIIIMAIAFKIIWGNTAPLAKNLEGQF